MWDTIQKLEYRVRANIEGAQQELNMRLTDRKELPLLGLNGEKLYLTGVTALRKRQQSWMHFMISSQRTGV